MSHSRIFLVAITLGFIGGFAVVAAANSSAPQADTHYSAEG